MSKYTHHSEFISRTLKILNKYECNCEFEKTLFLNSCLSLLIIPQQASEHDKNLSLDGDVDYENWGIDITKIKCPSTNNYTIENIAYHFRNSLCHFRFDLMSQDTEKIEKIRISDKNKPNDTENSFDLELSFSDFKKFVLKYATELKKQLASL